MVSWFYINNIERNTYLFKKNFNDKKKNYYKLT